MVFTPLLLAATVFSLTCENIKHTENQLEPITEIMMTFGLKTVNKGSKGNYVVNCTLRKSQFWKNVHFAENAEKITR
jgi:hypothetical protein